MFLAQATAKDGSGDRILIVGLSMGNVKRLLADDPIIIRRGAHGPVVPEGWEILIFVGETEQAIAERLRQLGAIDADTVDYTTDPRMKR